MPKVSIVIPVYNLESYIEKSLHSVFSQTLTDIEVITVDDGSADNSPAILDKIAKTESRLKVIHKENGGVSSARIAGIQAATGDYIGFVDGDDLIDADMFEHLLNNALANNADISHCGYRLICGDNTKYFYNSGALMIQNHKQGLCDLLKGEIIEPGLWNKLFRRALFDDLLNRKTIMDFRYKENEDLLMNFCLFEQAQKSVYEDFCPYQYLIRNTSASHGRINRHILMDPIQIGETLLEHNKDDKDLFLLSARYYVVKLKTAATFDYRSCPELADIGETARKKLRAFSKTYINLTEESSKRKLLCIFAAYLPNTYRMIHVLYLKKESAF